MHEDFYILHLVVVKFAADAYIALADRVHSRQGAAHHFHCPFFAHDHMCRGHRALLPIKQTTREYDWRVSAFSAPTYFVPTLLSLSLY